MAILRTLPVLALSLSSLVFLASCGDQQDTEVKEKPLRPVRTIEVAEPSQSRVHEFPAVVDANRKADLSFKVSGELIELNVRESQEVRAGQVLAKLDATDYQIQVNDAKASYEKALADLNRAKRLIKNDTISRSDYDQITANFNSAKARLESAQNNLNYTHLKASFSGVIAKIHTERYQEINAKQPIVTLHDVSNVELAVDIPENLMINARRDEPKRKAYAVFDAIDDVRFPAEFKEVTTQADEVTRTYKVTLVMEAPKDRTILPGMTARVIVEHLVPEQSKNSLYLPANVILKDGQGHYLFVVEAAGEGKGKVIRKAVTVGELTPIGLEVISGVETGEQVVSAGMSKVSDGMMVKLQ